ncbi:MAG: DinB family protein [Pseudomonadales bacterium]
MSFTLSYKRMARYNQWMNEAIYKASSKVNSDELNKDRGAFFGSIFGTLNHLMVGDIFWFKRFAEHQFKFPSLEYFRLIETPSSLKAVIHTSLASLTKEREKMDSSILLFTSELTDDAIASTLNYRNSKGHQFNKNFGHLLQHAFNHQTHHRGQASTLLYQAGIDVGVTDMLAGIPDE